ncbi:DUF397 domain-containing protein [Streptomyces sp. UNOB3_S3]|uniref:DUF397 domain-containing protein n=1 Tax=Streptomyces sp. UNOB3_S3 TaxID=2871682 RepID=UPI0023AF75AA|nr:DUF397 domain-containing protein [Streptomyces sp. UNOB3_S3]MCC3779010.1 DUF397 domain-containing protein [Streptomyces sp. UNOB3_S3]
MNTSRAWQKSSYSGGGPDNSCVELRPLDGSVAIRESDVPKAVVTAARAEVRALITRIKEGALQ